MVVSSNQSFLSRRTEKIIGRDWLESAIRQKKRLRIYFGIDPTAPNIHLGSAVSLLKLREFQEAGHRVILLIGDFTALVGDPSGHARERTRLSEREVEENLAFYLEQASKILDPEKLEVRKNSEWLSKLTLKDFIGFGYHFNAHQIAERSLFQERKKSGQRLSVAEFLYPLLQAIDALRLKADLQIGGSDQEFNMIAGRDLIRRLENREMAIMITPLILGTDGRKMSKTLGNSINLVDEADEMFGRIMSLPDDLIYPYFDLTTDISEEELLAIQSDLKEPKNRMLVKLKLANQIVKQFHGREPAFRAEEDFKRRFSKREMPLQLKSLQVKKRKGRSLVELLVESGLAKSKAQAKRLIAEGGVKIDGNQVDADQTIDSDKLSKFVLQVGRRRIREIVFQ